MARAIEVESPFVRQLVMGALLDGRPAASAAAVTVQPSLSSRSTSSRWPFTLGTPRALTGAPTNAKIS